MHQYLLNQSYLITLLLYDHFMPWAPKIASSKVIPCVSFSPTGVMPYSYFHHLHTMGTASTYLFQSVFSPSVCQAFVNMEKLTKKSVKDADRDEFLFGNFSRSTNIVLLNTCREIEGKYLDYLFVLCKKRAISTGLLIADAGGKKFDGDESDDQPSEIMKWLSGKDRSSTVYVSFGSECFMSKEQTAEIAKGLMLCGLNFIWALRFPAAAEKAVEEELPVGFLDAVRGRGLVVEWAPQTKILQHPSVGAFVSHSGWNSTIEGIYFGVPIVAILMQYEQPMNARVAVEAGAGVMLEKGGNGCYVGEDLAEAINKVMVCDEVREKAKLLSKKIRESEEHEVNDAAEHLLQICRNNMKQV